MMKTVLLITLVYLFHCEGAVVISSEIVNDRPIIGVLSQEQDYRLRDLYSKDNYTSYIAASYVKDIEASGARVVPIMIGKERSYYEELLGKINGVFFPGGATYFNQSNGYADAGQHIYEIAQKLNDEGDYFPVYGTCLGFELLIILASGRGPVENRVKCHSFDNAHLNFTPDFRSSKMFKNAPEDVIHLLGTKQITVNSHQFCIVDRNLDSHNLTDWRATAHSDDDHGLQFIASIENIRYPFFGTQFHPEKIAFEWVLSKSYPHTPEALKANRYFMDFFVNECRKNFHAFSDESEENQYLIYNYNPVFTGLRGSPYQQCYMFEPKGPLSSK